MEDASKTLDELRKRPVEQRIQLVEDLWDSIADDTVGESLAVTIHGCVRHAEGNILLNRTAVARRRSSRDMVGAAGYFQRWAARRSSAPGGIQ